MRKYDLSTARWRKSGYSNGDGGECIEVAYDFPGAARWRKSSHRSDDAGNCIEVVDDLPGVVPVRDSKDPLGPVLVVPAPGWTAFVDAVKGGSLRAS